MTARVAASGIACAVLLAGAALAAACGSSGAGPAASSTATPGIGEAASRAIAALCESRQAAAGGDTRRANDRFVDGAHDTLHRLAADVQTGDPAAAAGVLEAMNRVESALRPSGGTANASALAALFDGLIAATQRAAASLGIQAPACGA